MARPCAASLEKAQTESSLFMIHDLFLSNYLSKNKSTFTAKHVQIYAAASTSATVFKFALNSSNSDLK